MAKPPATGERSEKKRAVRRNIMNAALHLCQSKGYSGLSLREITREAGIAAPSFYNHFSDLEDLGLAIIDEAGVTLRQLLRHARKSVDITESPVRRSIDTFNRYLADNGELFHFIVAERVGGVKSFRAAIEREVNHIIEDLGESLQEEGVAHKRPIAHPVLVSDLIVNCVFNSGAASLKLSPAKRKEAVNKSVMQVRMIMYGAETLFQKIQDKKENAEESAQTEQVDTSP